VELKAKKTRNGVSLFRLRVLFAWVWLQRLSLRSNGQGKRPDCDPEEPTNLKDVMAALRQLQPALLALDE